MAGSQLEVVCLDETTPQITVPQVGETYFMPRDLNFGVAGQDGFIGMTVNTEFMIIGSSTTQTAGGNIVLAGSSESLSAGDLRFRTGATTVGHYDFSVDRWSWGSKDFLAVGNITCSGLTLGAGGPIWTTGSGTPESAVTADVGSLFTRTDGGASTTLYVKESGTGNTGWVAK